MKHAVTTHPVTQWIQEWKGILGRRKKAATGLEPGMSAAASAQQLLAQTLTDSYQEDGDATDQ